MLRFSFVFCGKREIILVRQKSHRHCENDSALTDHTALHLISGLNQWILLDVTPHGKNQKRHRKNSPKHKTFIPRYFYASRGIVLWVILIQNAEKRAISTVKSVGAKRIPRIHVGLGFSSCTRGSKFLLGTWRFYFSSLNILFLPGIEI